MLATVCGRVLHAPQEKIAKTGSVYIEVTLVDSTAGKDRATGEKKSVFVTLRFFGARCDFAQRYMTPGSGFIASGHLDGRPYLGKDGSPRVAYSMIPDTIAFLPTARQEDRPAPDPVQQDLLDEGGDEGEEYNVPF